MQLNLRSIGDNASADKMYQAVSVIDVSHAYAVGYSRADIMKIDECDKCYIVSSGSSQHVRDRRIIIPCLSFTSWQRAL